ncbi:MAG TPA: LPS export ABC transporter ATP-binding protein [Crenotrichaceae bacterium]|nr:LPS export ABC transporter ATP-binding protein [Crenotrichaceae bacterium]
MSRLFAVRMNKRYKKHQVVNNVSLSVNQGEIVALLGPNGAGKSTAFYMLVGLIPVDSGGIQIDEYRITKLPMHKRAELGVGYLPQEASIFRKMTVSGNIRAVLELRRDLSIQKREQKIDALLNEFGIAALRNREASALSGGERRRAEIARILATEPKFLLLDEPFAAVDPITVNDIQATLHHLRDRDIGILITDHKVQETLGICNRAYVMDAGQVIEEGSVQKVVENKEVRKVLLGDDFKL